MVNNLSEQYKLKPGLTKNDLTKVGFDRFGIYRKWLYGKSVQLEIEVNFEEWTYTYNVIDVNNKQIYIPYYNNEYGVNQVLDKVNRNIREAFEELNKKGIFI